jgi:hypothetical protein
VNDSTEPAVSALLEAVRRGDHRAVAALVAAGARLDDRDEHDWTPLCWAAGAGDVAIVETLLDAGADPLAAAHGLRTPYDIALAAGRVDAARRLRTAELAADPEAAARRATRPYCKAYELSALRRFSAWHEPDDGSDPLTDESVVFVHQDLSVTRSMWHGEDVLFASEDHAWHAFCSDELEFRVPDDLELIPAPDG